LGIFLVKVIVHGCIAHEAGQGQAEDKSNGFSNPGMKDRPHTNTLNGGLGCGGLSWLFFFGLLRRSAEVKGIKVLVHTA
jgi:hypothetical protein